MSKEKDETGSKSFVKSLRLTFKGDRDHTWSASSDDLNKIFSLRKLKEEMSETDKVELYKAIGYQEDAQESRCAFPKSFVANIWSFTLYHLIVAIRDDERRNSAVLTLSLTNVQVDVAHRPSANYFLLKTSMEKLSVTGYSRAKNASPPIIVDTIATAADASGRATDLLSVKARRQF